MSPESAENLLYTRCTECLNEGWLFCTLCNRHFCDDHACHHLAAQVDKDIHGVNYGMVSTEESINNGSPDNSVNSGSNSNINRGIDSLDGKKNRRGIITLRELSPDALTNTPEIELRSYFRRLLSEAKRVQREIERRMIYSTELIGGPSFRNKAHLSGDARDKAKNAGKDKLDTSPEAFAARLLKEENERKRAQAKQATIAEAIKIISQQIKLGNLKPEDIKKKVGK